MLLSCGCPHLQGPAISNARAGSCHLICMHADGSSFPHLEPSAMLTRLGQSRPLPKFTWLKTEGQLIGPAQWVETHCRCSVLPSRPGRSSLDCLLNSGFDRTISTSQPAAPAECPALSRVSLSGQFAAGRVRLDLLLDLDQPFSPEQERKRCWFRP